MKKFLLFAAIGLGLLTASCTKKTDNYYANPTPAFIISGIQDFKMQADAIPVAQLNLTVQYMDSAQQGVTLALSGLPAGITLDTNAVLSGVPTFSTTLTFYDTSSTPAAPGTYPITLTCYSAASAQKTFTFYITVQPEPNYTANMVGRYTNSSNSCSGVIYTDSVYADASVQNKIYFHNFMNTGQTVYANVTSASPQSTEYIINLPQQTVGSYTFQASQGEYFENEIFMQVQYIQNGSSTFCTLQMFK